MIKFYVFSNLSAMREISGAGFRCSVLVSRESFLADTVLVTMKKARELAGAAGFINGLSRRYCVLMILMRPKTGAGGLVCHDQGACLTEKETVFLSRLINDDVVKKTMAEMGISHSGYYKLMHRLLDKLGLENVQQLRAWALMHLSV